MPIQFPPPTVGLLHLWNEPFYLAGQLSQLQAVLIHQLALAYGTFSNHPIDIVQKFQERVSLTQAQEELFLFVQSIQQHPGRDNEEKSPA
tara:strand:- start:54 stop:323 length:270 start_codon:yes stop_codon:yes gene_type:complete